VNVLVDTSVWSLALRRAHPVDSPVVQELAEHTVGLWDHPDVPAGEFHHGGVVQTECFEKREDETQRVTGFVAVLSRYLRKIIVVKTDFSEKDVTLWNKCLGQFSGVVVLCDRTFAVGNEDSPRGSFHWILQVTIEMLKTAAELLSRPFLNYGHGFYPATPL